MTTKKKTARALQARQRKNITGALGKIESAELVRRLNEDELAYLFKHALVQDAAYVSLLKQERRQLHLETAHALEALYPERLNENAARLTQHYTEAGATGKIAEYAERAGDFAASLFAYPEARTYYAIAERALEQLPASEANARHRIDAIVKYISIALRLDGPEPSLARLQVAEDLLQRLSDSNSTADRTRGAQVQFWQGDAHLHRGEPGVALQHMQTVMQAAQAGVDDVTLPAIAANVFGRALVVQGHFSQAQPYLEQAVPVLEESSNWYEWVLAKGFLALALAARGQIQAGLAEVDAALARAKALDTVIGVVDGYLITAVVRMYDGNAVAMRAAAEQSYAAAVQVGDQLLQYITSGFRGWAETKLGDLEAATIHFAISAQIAERLGGRLFFADWFSAARAEFQLRIGNWQAAIGMASETVELGQEMGGIYSLGLAHAVWAQALVMQQEWGEADRHFAASVAAFDKGDAQPDAIRTEILWAECLRGARRTADATSRLDDARARAQRVASPIEVPFET